MERLLIPSMPSTPAALRSQLSAPRRRGWARAMTGVWMVLHLFLVAAAPAVDAGVGHTEQVLAHWEDSDGGDCPTSHGAEECQICHLVVKARAQASNSVATAIPATADQQVPERARPAPPSFAFLDGHSSRAPPLG